jgi:dihydrofolate reductase
MRKLRVFNGITMDGYFTDPEGGMSWAHDHQDAEWEAFSAENARGGDVAFLFGRKTYDMMKSYWPTPQARETAPEVAKAMNSRKKMVFSRTLTEATWNNTEFLKGDPVTEVRRLKQEGGPDLLIFGSGTIVAPLAQAGLIDEYELVLNPRAIGRGRTMFDGVKEMLSFKLTKARPFKNGNVVLWYEPTA